MGGLNYKDGIIHYYLFQKKLSNYFRKIKYEDEYELNVGYLINPEWINYWKSTINYNRIKYYLDGLNIRENDLVKYEYNLDSFINKYINQEEIKKLSNTVKTNNFDIIHENIFDLKLLKNFMPENIFKALKVNDKTTKIEIKYILKKRMLIFVLKEYQIIKLIIPDISYFSENKNVVNLSWNFYDVDTFYSKIEFLKDNNSEFLMDYFINKNVFATPIIKIAKNDVISHMIINEELYHQAKFENENNYYSYYNEENNDNDLIIKQPQDINFELVKRESFRGLDNVGATCYMNATLQNLANIKPITDYLLNANKYIEIYDNGTLCPLTLQYCQVLLGLFCDQSNIGSYSPKLFKMVIGEMNPLFEGVQANDSKDLIIFLLEVLNTELSNLHNKKHNKKKVENDTLPNIDPANTEAVLREFLNDYKFSHSTIIGENLCGFQKNVFICQNCGAVSNNFNIFNFIIFGLEATANHFNLNNNYNGVPVLTFDHCFQFLMKEELFQDTYCQKCKITGNSKYKENIYLMPNYLIIILNRGKGNIFNCIVNIPEIFDSSNYEERNKNKKYELIGIVSHFGESGMGGHFIAFCKHNKDQKWRCYNDSVVTECQNDYLNKGTPYILFYKYMDLQNNNQQKKTINLKSSFNPNALQNYSINNNANANQNFNTNKNTNAYNNFNNNINANPIYNLQNSNMSFNAQKQNMQMNYPNNNQNMMNQGGFNMGNNMSMSNNFQGNMNQNNQNMNFPNNNYPNNMNWINMNNMGNMNNMNNNGF